MRRLAITGAGGFIGRAVVAAALARPDIQTIRATDRDLSALPDDPRIERIEGDICAPTLQDRLWQDASAMIHLAAVPGGAAERDVQASQRVNLEASLALMARASGRRFVLASSIAVYGAPPPALVDDATPLAPRMIYAMHKMMAEIALQTLSERGELCGLALRIPGVVPRMRGVSGLKSAFLSDLFHAARDGERITLPVGPQGRSWIASPLAVARGLIHGALLPSAVLGAQRCFALPAQSPTITALIAALQQAYPAFPAPDHAPQPELEAQFTSFGDLVTPEATRLGFPRDAALGDIVAAARQMP